MDVVETLYERDFVAWTEAQAQAIRRLRDLRPNVDVGIDCDKLIEEVLDMGRSVRRSYRSFVAQIILHLLKLEHSPARDPRSHWVKEVRTFRIAAEDAIDDAPSVRASFDVADAYRLARRLAVVDLEADDVSERSIPPRCPYDLDTQILSEDWFPENRHGHRP